MNIEENRNCNCGYNDDTGTLDNNCGCGNNEQENTITYRDNETETTRNTNCSTRREMMQEIRSLEFAIIELALYLDTHPEDQKALCLHNKYCKEVKELKDKYQKVYGPLTINYPCNKWRWLEEPWPWERGNY